MAAKVRKPGVCIGHMLNLVTVITYEDTETVYELIVGGQLTGHNLF